MSGRAGTLGGAGADRPGGGKAAPDEVVPDDAVLVAEVRPRERADVVVNSEDPAAPRILRRSLPV